MGRPPAARLTSEERCAKAFEAWYPTSGIAPQRPVLDLVAWNAWKACWKYLESRVEEFIRE